MSLVRPVINGWLRMREKPYLRRVQDPEEIRQRFERTARIFFHAPSGTRREDITLGGRPALALSRRGIDDAPIVLYFHGGAYVFGSPRTHDAMLARLCMETGGRAFLQDYRKAPEHLFPAAPDDAEAAWRDLLAQGYDPARIVIGGDSSGGGLALALLSRILERGYPMPAGLFALSPLTDLGFSGESLRRNAAADPLLPTERVHDLAEMYLAGHDPSDPRASPLNADFLGACPVWVSVSDTEILLDDSLRLASKLHAAGVDVTLDRMPDLPHVWPLLHNILPEARATLAELGAWIRLRTDATTES